MKKIVLASAAMGGAALVAFGASGTFAAFSDAESVYNEAGAGTVLLSASSPSTTLRADALSLAPGEEASYAYFLKNDGDTAANLVGDFITRVNNENGCYDPEAVAGDNCTAGSDGSALGELPQFLTLSARSVPGVTQASDCTIDRPGTTFLTPTAYTAVEDLPPYTFTQLAGGGAFCFVLTASLPTTATNVVQSDRVQFEIFATLTQATS